MSAVRIDSARALASRWTPWLFNAGVAIVLRLALPADISARGERYTYYAMSRAFPLAQCSLFHCFRFLAPLYAALPPLGVLDSFIAIGFLFQILAGVMLWHVADLVTGSPRVAFLASAWYWATWGPILSFSDPLLITDPAQAFWSLAALWLLLAGRYPLALAMLTAGAGVKESVLLVPMVYGLFVVLTQRRPEWRLPWLALLVILPAATWLGLRAFLHLHHAYSVAGDAEYLRRTYFFGVWLPGLGPFPRNVQMALLQMFGAFGAAWILGGVGWFRANRRVRALTTATIPAMVFLAVYQIPDRALAGFPWAILIPAGIVANALPGGMVAALLVVNAAFTMRMNAALSWLPPASLLVSVLAVLTIAGLWRIRRSPTPSAAHVEENIARPRGTWTVAVTSIAILAVAASLVTGFTVRAAGTPRVVQFSPPAGTGGEGDEAIARGLALSPEETQLVFVGRDRSGAIQLWLRSLASGSLAQLDGTRDAEMPFWSPDGGRIAFFADGRLKTLDLGTRRVASVADAPASRGGAWGADDLIVFAPAERGGLFQVSARGGTPVPVTTVEPALHQISHRWPSFLPGGRSFFFTAWAWKPEDRALYLARGSARPERILGGVSNATYADGMLFFLDALGALRAHPFDMRRQQAIGETAMETRSIVVAPSGDGAFSVGPRTLVLAARSAPGAPEPLSGNEAWRDREGHRADVQRAPPGTPRGVVIDAAAMDATHAELSPDGRWVALTASVSGVAQIVVQAYPPAGPRWQVSTTGATLPRWRLDGRELFFLTADGHVAVVSVDTTAGFRADAPRTLFAVDSPGDTARAGTDLVVSADGRHLRVPGLVREPAPVFIVGRWQNRLPL